MRRLIPTLAAPMQGLKKARLAKGWTQEDMGLLLGCTKSHYGKFELGHTPMSYADAAVAARALGVPMEALA